MRALRSGRTWRTIVLRGALFSLAWWAIVEGRPMGWYFTVAGVVAATALSLLLFPAGRWTLLGFLRFIPFFIVESIRGGVDVALRALRPGTHVDPGFVEYRFASADPHVRLLATNVTSLMPGTLSARIEGDTMVVHLLDVQSTAGEMPARVEERVAAMTRAEH